ncbi:MAG: two-component regulator propeller domain-containing protein, partial [Mucilaginibacter sp.]
MMIRYSLNGALVWLIAFCTAGAVKAQSNIKFTTLTVKEGLSSNTVNAIVKDKYGVMWLGTANGLSKFDGTNFTVYRRDTENPYSLSSDGILSLYEDHSGTLWIGSDAGGISYYDRKFDRFVRY